MLDPQSTCSCPPSRPPVPVEWVAAEVVLLDAVSCYFDFDLGTLCGIPTITLEGTTADWESLAVRVEGFAEFGLKPWVEVLRPILRQLVRASTGDVDKDFWQSLYKSDDQCGSSVITGWITAFFPYLKHSATGRATVPVECFFVGGRDVSKMLYPSKTRREISPTVPR